MQSDSVTGNDSEKAGAASDVSHTNEKKYINDGVAQTENLPQNVREICQFLQQHPPFDAMPQQEVVQLVENSKLQFYAAGDVIIDSDAGVCEELYIVKQGSVAGYRVAGENQDPSLTFTIGPGYCFPLSALINERVTYTSHEAAEDTFCILCSKEAFQHLLTSSAVFREFCMRGVSSLLDQVNRQIQAQVQTKLGADYSLQTSLEDYLGRSPVHCRPDISVQQAVAQMHEQGVGSIIVTNDEMRPLGIFTLRDLRQLIADDPARLGAPIHQAMNHDPLGLPPSATAFEAAMEMATNHFAHILIVENGKLRGVISERDLFALQRVNLVHVSNALRGAADIEKLAGLQPEVAQLAENMLAYGASAQQMNRVITELNDCTTRRAIELAMAAEPCPDWSFTFLIFGSAARCEQTLLTDQDNALLFVTQDNLSAEDMRKRFLPTMQKVNDYLDECGFVYCPGNIMAGNPELCLSKDEWQTWFQKMIASATPQHLLDSAIYFDLRCQYGEEQPYRTLLESVIPRVKQNTLFQRMFAEAALQNRPPLGWFNSFKTKRKDGASVIDLKKQGLTPFVDAARVLSLAHGITATNTVDRLQALADAEVCEAADVEAWIEACELIQITRLRHHFDLLEQGKPLSNLLDPDTLNPLEERVLKEAFRQAQRLQKKLAWTYQL